MAPPDRTDRDLVKAEMEVLMVEGEKDSMTPLDTKEGDVVKAKIKVLMGVKGEIEVLMVEDDKESYMLLSKLVRSRQYHVTYCAQVEEAVQLLKERKETVDVILCGLHMQDRDGFESLDSCALDLGVTILFMTFDEPSDSGPLNIQRRMIEFYKKRCASIAANVANIETQVTELDKKVASEPCASVAANVETQVTELDKKVASEPCAANIETQVTELDKKLAANVANKRRVLMTELYKKVATEPSDPGAWKADIEELHKLRLLQDKFGHLMSALSLEFRVDTSLFRDMLRTIEHEISFEAYSELFQTVKIYIAGLRASLRHGAASDVQVVDFDKVAKELMLLQGTIAYFCAGKFTILCEDFLQYCHEKDLEGCTSCVLELDFDFNAFKSKVGAVFQVMNEIFAVGGSLDCVLL